MKILDPTRTANLARRSSNSLAKSCTVELRVEIILRPTVSRSVRLGIGLPLGTHDQILSLSFLYWQLLCCSSCRTPSLTRGRVCNLQCNRWVVRSLTIHYRLIWNWVPYSSPLEARGDYGGGILTSLNTGEAVPTTPPRLLIGKFTEVTELSSSLQYPNCPSLFDPYACM
jgi:hypothetical protein